MRGFRVWPAVLVLLAAAPAVSASEDVLRYAQIAGEAKAFAKVCPVLAFDSAAVTQWGVARGLAENSVKWSDAEFFYGRTIAAWQARSEADACAAAERLYGPEGRMAKGILKGA